MLDSPPATRVETVEETLHGVQVVDRYRWLEDGDSTETRAWTAAQNTRTRAALARLPSRARIRERLAELWAVGLLGAPRRRGHRYFFLRRAADQEQAVLYLRRGPGGADEALIDPNAGEGLTTIDWWHPSWDGRFVAYGLSSGGDELSTLHVLDVDARRQLPDRIPDTRNATVAWLPDASGFFYTRYPPGERYDKRVRFHRLGEDSADDPLIFGDGRPPTHLPSVSITRDGRWLLVHVHQGWAKQSLYVLDRSLPQAGFTPVGEEHEAIFFGRVEDGRLFVLSNWHAPNWRILELDPTAPDLARARVLVPERADVVLSAAQIVGGHICLLELQEAVEHLRIHAADGAFEREIGLPGQGSVLEWSGEWAEPELLYTAHSFLEPPATFRCDVGSGEVEEFDRLPAPLRFDPADHVVQQVRCRSKDGTAIPIFLIHRRGVRPDGTNPTILNGYGGFNVNRTPAYAPAMPLWLEAGGVYAVAVLRGGGEFGEAWHRAGMLDRKQNVFDDFVAAADWLVRERYTSRERLVLWGGSNGGLLVGAALTQRPDLARAVVCTVPLLDMLRYHHFQIAKLWISEYGSAEDPEQFHWLRAYSPYHQVRDGERYPAVLLASALGDSRVDPMHARKMAARLQAATASGLPVLLRVEEHAGHGIGKPRWKQLEESADLWAFTFWQLGVEA